MTSSEKTLGPGPAIAVLGVLLAALFALSGVVHDSLRHLAYLSGWALMGLLLLLGLVSTEKIPPMLHGLVGILALALFGAHVEFGLPEGWYEILLAALFLAVSLSGLFGRGNAENPSTGYYVHVSLTWALLGFALIHGILMHAHGLLASVLG